MTDKHQGKLRYRLYFWLMNLTLLFALVGALEYLVSLQIGARGFGLSGTVNTVAATIVGLFGWFVPFVLMIAKFMRDDYAEMLWKRTVVVLAYAVAVFPVVSVLLAWTFELSLPHDGPAYAAWREIYGPFRSAGVRGDVIVSTVWQLYMWFFVFTFQFLRWRDSR